MWKDRHTGGGFLSRIPSSAHGIISLLADPKENPNWQLFCNYLKLIALALNGKEYLIPDATGELIDDLINAACDSISY